MDSDTDVPFDEEFYMHMCITYGSRLREKIFFFIDNRNVIGKDVPFQLIHRRRFNEPLFIKSVVLAHDVDDFSKIWQVGGLHPASQSRRSIPNADRTVLSCSLDLADP